MIPLEKPWYQKLLLFAALIGAAGGAMAVVFMTITGTASDLLYGNTGFGW